MESFDARVPKGGNEAWVDSARIVEESYHDPLEMGNFLGGGQRGVILERRILNMLTILLNSDVELGILWHIWNGVLILVQGIYDISCHGKFHMRVHIIQVQSNTTVQATSPIF
jgi:hypothetical protein